MIEYVSANVAIKRELHDLILISVTPFKLTHTLLHVLDNIQLSSFFSRIFLKCSLNI